MNKFLLYINQVLESLDIPTTSEPTPKKLKTPTRNRTKKIRLEKK